jgi:hypothetical protein
MRRDRNRRPFDGAAANVESGCKRQFSRHRLTNDAPQLDGPSVQHLALSLDTADDREIIYFVSDRREGLAVISLGGLMVEALRNGGFR